MAEDLRIEIGANTKALTANLTQAQGQLKSFAAEASRSSALLGGSMVRGTDQAANALQNLSRVTQDAPFGFIGIQNNLNPLLESFQRLKQETGSTGGALKALGSSLMGPGGLGLAMAAVSAGILLYQQYQQKANKATNDAKKNTEEYITTLSQLDQAQLKGAQTAAGEIATLKILYAQTQDVTLSQKQRLNAVNQLQSEYPSYFKNISDEAILAGKASAQYNQLAAAIVATARARAATDLITKNESRRLEDTQKVIDLQKEELRLQTSLQSIIDRPAERAAGNAGVGAAQGQGAARERANLEKQIADNKAQQRNLGTDMIKIDQQNLQLVKAINIETTKGALLTGSVGSVPSAGPKERKAKETPFFRAEEVAPAMQDISGRIGIGLDGILAQYNKTAAQINLIPLVPFPEPIAAQLAGISQVMRDFNGEMSDIINGGLVNAFAGIGEAIGGALANGTNLAASLGAGLLGALGSVLGQLGQMAIATGIAIMGIKTALKSLNPVVAIAAGVALLALSGVVKGAASRLGGGMGSSGGGGGVASGGGSYSASAPSSQSGGAVNTFNGGRVVFEISGQKLIGVLSNTQAANLRVGP